METGGFKGRVARVPKADLYRLFRERLGIESVVNEYGMTELSTQFYDERPLEYQGRTALGARARDGSGGPARGAAGLRD